MAEPARCAAEPRLACGGRTAGGGAAAAFYPRGALLPDVNSCFGGGEQGGIASAMLTRCFMAVPAPPGGACAGRLSAVPAGGDEPRGCGEPGLPSGLREAGDGLSSSRRESSRRLGPAPRPGDAGGVPQKAPDLLCRGARASLINSVEIGAASPGTSRLNIPFSFLHKINTSREII